MKGLLLAAADRGLMPPWRAGGGHRKWLLVLYEVVQSARVIMIANKSLHWWSARAPITECYKAREEGMHVPVNPQDAIAQDVPLIPVALVKV